MGNSDVEHVPMKETGLKALLNVRKYIPSIKEVTEPLPPDKMDLVLQGVLTDIVGWTVGNIPTVGDFIADFVNDNIMADVATKMTQPQRTELNQQDRVYPNGVALFRTFHRIPD